MDPYKARKDVIKKMLLEELEAQSHNSDIGDNEMIRSDTSDNEYVPSELIKKNVTMCLHMKLILMEITWLHQMIVMLIVKQMGVMKQKMENLE